jgi:hypothetical protein
METFNDVAGLLGVVGTVSAIIIGWTGINRAVKESVRRESSNMAVMETNISHIRNGMDEIKFELKSQGNRQQDIFVRVAQIEGSVKSAHHRLDNLEAKI